MNPMNNKILSGKLRSAVNSGDLKAVQRLVKGGVDVNAKYWYDSTLLHEAVSMSNIQLIRLLVKSGADVNNTNQDGRTALHLACRGGNADIVQLLIKEGTDVNKKSLDGKTCLHVAIWRGHSKVIQLLLEAKANPDIPDSEGRTPLFWAARYEQMDVLKMLVEGGAKVNYIAKNKWTPLHIALKHNHIDVVKYLVLQGVETNLSVRDLTVVSLIASQEATPLKTKQEMIEMFVRAGYNLGKDHWRPGAETPETGPEETRMLYDWIESKKGEVPQLMRLCRTRIRKRLSYCNKGRSILPFLRRLSIPTPLADYLSMKDDPFLRSGEDGAT